MQLTPAQVRHIAKLARIRLTDEELAKFAPQMVEIIKFVEKLNECDVEKVEETNQVTGLANVLREDEIKPFEKMKELIKCSENPIENGQIKVKKSI